MSAFVLDASVTMRWCFEDGKHAYADYVLEQLELSEALVPVLWRYEVSAVLVKAQKSGMIAAEKATTFLDTLANLKITVEQGWHKGDLRRSSSLSNRSWTKLLRCILSPTRSSQKSPTSHS